MAIRCAFRLALHVMAAKPIECPIALLLCRLIDEQYTNRPFYGSRRMVVYLRQAGHRVNRKHVRRLMRQMGLAGMAPGPNTSRPHPEHKIYPYLLRGLTIGQPNQVSSTDITPPGKGLCLSGGDHRLVQS